MVPEGVRNSMAKVPLRSILDSTPRKTGGSGCKTCTLLDSLDADDKNALLEYLESDVATRVIVEALSAFGVRLSISAVSRHRRECRPLN